MIRTKVKGTRFKAASSPESEPDFYQMPPVIVTPNNSSDEYSYETESRPDQYVAAAVPQVQGFDPLPVSFSGMLHSAPVESRMYEAAPAAISYAAMPESMNERSYADQVLDEAVDELFLQEALMESDSAFGFDGNFGDDASLQDEQLGMLLEQLLEE